MRRNSYIFTAVMAITMALGCAAVAMANDAVPAELFPRNLITVSGKTTFAHEPIFDFRPT